MKEEVRIWVYSLKRYDSEPQKVKEMYYDFFNYADECFEMNIRNGVESFKLAQELYIKETGSKEPRYTFWEAPLPPPAFHHRSEPANMI